MVKIALVDDHQIVRDGIKSLLEGQKGVEVVAEAENAQEFFSKLIDIVPDIAIVDISLPGMSGIDLTKQLSDTHPNIKVIMLSMYTTQEFNFNAIKAGAKGYLPKNITQLELIEAIANVNEGKEYFSKDISEVILKNYLKQIKNRLVALYLANHQI